MIGIPKELILALLIGYIIILYQSFTVELHRKDCHWSVIKASVIEGTVIL